MGVELGTRYLGMELRNPIVIASCPLAGELDSLKQLEDAGASAAVLPSLFAEQIEHEEQNVVGLYDEHAESSAESTNYFPQSSRWLTGSEPYLDYIARCKEAVDIPIIASLNGKSQGSWVRLAQLMEEAGADALELNVYFVPTDQAETSAVIEQRYLELVAAVKETLTIPLSVKIGPYFSSLPNLTQRLVEAGADGLVLFNRYLEPDIDTEALQIAPSLVLSDRHELRLALRWIATLHGQLECSIAATSGIHFAEDVVKAMLAGADVAMMAAAVLRYGPQRLVTVLREMERWLEIKEYDSIRQLQGSMSAENYDNSAAYHRGNYMKAVVSYSSE